MCRLFGQHAHPGQDLCEPLCSASNALRMQSHAHPHGWGIGWWERGRPHVRKGLLPAHEDDEFVATALEARSRVIVAHVRDASVGPVAETNTHPFAHGRWLFAHNGTVARFARSGRVREALLAEIDRDLRDGIRGDTDSERCFHVFLSRLRSRARLDRASLPDVRRALAETTATVAAISDRAAERPSSLNFLVSDGRVLATCRRGRTLHVAAGAGPRRAFVVASERIGADPAWQEVPEGGFAGTEDGARAVRGPLLPPRPSRRATRGR